MNWHFLIVNGFGTRYTYFGCEYNLIYGLGGEIFLISITRIPFLPLISFVLMYTKTYQIVVFPFHKS